MRSCRWKGVQAIHCYAKDDCYFRNYYLSLVISFYKIRTTVTSKYSHHNHNQGWVLPSKWPSHRQEGNWCHFPLRFSLTLITVNKLPNPKHALVFPWLCQEFIGKKLLRVTFKARKFPCQVQRVAIWIIVINVTSFWVLMWSCYLETKQELFTVLSKTAFYNLWIFSTQSNFFKSSSKRVTKDPAIPLWSYAEDFWM